jgi:hypothetical protein
MGGTRAKGKVKGKKRKREIGTNAEQKRKKKERAELEGEFDAETWLDEKLEEANGNVRWTRAIIKEVRELEKSKRERIRREITFKLIVENGEEERRLELIRQAASAGIKEDEVSKKRIKPNMIMSLEFENPGFERTGIGGIIKSRAVIDSLPFGVEVEDREGGKDIDLDELPVVVYSYVEDIRRAILNYKKVLEETESMRLAQIPCDCEGSEYCNEKLGHILTGDLSIVKEAKLRELLTKGPKYRERRKVDLDKVREGIKQSLEQVVQAWSNKKDIAVVQFAEWKQAVIDGTNSNLLTSTHKTNGDKKEEVLKSESGIAALEELHARFALVSADKSENNVIVVCRRYYVQRLREELEGKPEAAVDNAHEDEGRGGGNGKEEVGEENEGVGKQGKGHSEGVGGRSGKEEWDGVTAGTSNGAPSLPKPITSSSSSSSSASSLPPNPTPPSSPQPPLAEEVGAGEKRTYRKEKRKQQELVKEMTEKLERWNIKVEEQMERLATLYWTAKMHKLPPKERFIASSRRCVTKPLSQLLAKCLKLVQSTWKRKCERDFKKTGIKSFWIVESTDEVLKVVEEVNKRGEARDVESYDFSTLYTKIEHEDLKEAMKFVVEGAFEEERTKLDKSDEKAGIGKREHNIRMSVYNTSAKFVAEPKEGTFAVTAAELLELIELLVDNIYVAYGEQVYRQWIGIPMGTDCAPFLANLYLFAKEHRWITGIAITDRELALCFSLTERYIDDLLSINGGGAIGKHKDSIYPRSLVLNKENKDNHTTHFLDANFTINDKRIIRTLYDKRDEFPFEVRSFPDLSGNVHFKNSHGVLAGQLQRIAKVSTHFEQFSKRVRALTSKLVNQSFDKVRLGNVCKKFYNERKSLVQCYRQNKKEVDEGLFIASCFDPPKT